MAEWSTSEYYPIQRGDEITAQHFGIIRQIMWAIDAMTWKEVYELPPDWRADTVYNQWALVAYPDQFGVKRPWLNTVTYSYGTPPPMGNWQLAARDNVYTDYNRNSGCYIYPDKYHAHRKYPPDFNKYTQYAIGDENGWHWPYAKLIVWRVKNLHNGQYEYFKHDDAPTRLLFDLPTEEENIAANYKWDLENAERVAWHKGQEHPVEFSLDNPWFLQDLISGPIGTQYVEYHPTFFGWPPPWYYPYYVWPGSPVEDHKYYCKKWQGYQSGVERFVEFNGSMFQWPLAEGTHECDLGLCPLRDSHQGTHFNYWKCNWSAFEKCLSLHAGEGEAEAKATDKYDWYLDVEFPPDPNMYKMLTQYYYDYLVIKAVWRRTWRYSFKPVRNGMYWPGDWGPPPHWDESYFWWCRWDNVLTAYNEARAKLRNGNQADVQAMVARHYPVYVVDGFAKKAESEDAGDWDYWDEITRLQDAWEQFLDELTAITTGDTQSPPVPVGYKGVYEMTAQMLNDMKGVLDKLKYVEASVGKQVWGELKASYEPPLPNVDEWEPWCGWDWTGEWYWVENQNWLGEYCGYTQMGTAYWGGVRSWNATLGKYQYNSWGYGGISRKIKWRFTGSNIENWLKSAKFNQAYVCMRIQGAAGAPGIGINCDWSDSCDIACFGSVNGIHTCADPIYRWLAISASALSDGSGVDVIYSGSASGGWQAPPAHSYCGPTTRSLWAANVAYLAHTTILLILDYTLVPLGGDLVVRAK